MTKEYAFDLRSLRVLKYINVDVCITIGAEVDHILILPYYE